jgi:predicted RNase H-like nuclease (RuvC/YqgF family)
MTLTRLIPALFAAAVLAAPAVGQTPEELKRTVEKLEKVVKDLQDAKDGLKNENVREKVATIDSKLDQLDQDIQTIKKDLRDLKRKVDSGSSTSLRPDYDSTTVRGQGRVRLINDFPEEMSVRVNGLSYRLSPGQEKLVAVPPGEFTYQVLQIHRDPRVRQIVADETKNIRIYPIQ